MARWEIGGFQTQQSASLGPGAVAASSPLAGSELSRVRTQLVLRAHESECKSRPGLSRFADSESGTELSQTLRGQQTSHRSDEPFERLSGIHASIHA